MAARRQHDGTDLSATDSQVGSSPHAIVITPGSSGFNFTWPTIAACVMLLGFMAALKLDSAHANVSVVEQLLRLIAWKRPLAEPEARQALVITATRIDQLTVVATLSPRGFHPLLASTRREVLAQIRANPGALKLAVIDDTMPDYAFIARVLKDNIPGGCIIVLKGSHRSQDIGPMLLMQLERL